MKILIQNSNYKASNGEMKQADILIEDGIITKIDKKLETAADRIVDANGLLVAPGFIDLHIHLREPGGEKKETIETAEEVNPVLSSFPVQALLPSASPCPSSFCNFLLSSG